VGYTQAPPGWWQEFVRSTARPAVLAVTRLDGSPHAAPVWIDLDTDADGTDVLVFTTHRETIKGKSIVRDGRVCLTVDDDAPPFSFVTITGRARVSEDPDELLRWATRIGGRYMGADRAEEYGRRNGVPGEMVVRVRADKVVAKVDIAD
jgi:PPOX class probable F420-dependent enzyme